MIIKKFIAHIVFFFTKTKAKGGYITYWNWLENWLDGGSNENNKL